jgi:hypothetical protein
MLKTLQVAYFRSSHTFARPPAASRRRVLRSCCTLATSRAVRRPGDLQQLVELGTSASRRRWERRCFTLRRCCLCGGQQDLQQLVETGRRLVAGGGGEGAAPRVSPAREEVPKTSNRSARAAVADPPHRRFESCWVHQNPVVRNLGLATREVVPIVMPPSSRVSAQPLLRLVASGSTAQVVR